MADGKNYYPMMSGAAWRKLRDQFQKAMPGTVSRSYLANVLGITERSAANLLGPMRSLGLIDHEGTPTDRAGHWCLDDHYQAVCNAMLADVYPADLRSAIADPSGSRDAAIAWFKQNGGVGKAGATKMAATYELVAEAGSARDQLAQFPEPAATVGLPEPPPAAVQPNPSRFDPLPAVAERHAPPQANAPSLHHDIHVHIAADASAEQIEQIFASMARHLHRPI